MTPIRSIAVVLTTVVISGGCGTDPPRRASRTSTLSVPSPPGWPKTLRARCRAVEPAMRRAAAEFGIDIGLIAGIIRVESSFRPEAESRAGALGLMQVMPSTAARLDCDDLDEPDSNIACGARVLLGFLKRFDGDLIYGLSGYNAGYRAPLAARKVGGLPSNLRYIEKVLAARAHYLRHGCGR